MMGIDRFRMCDREKKIHVSSMTVIDADGGTGNWSSNLSVILIL